MPLLLALLWATQVVQAQCTHDPRIAGDTILCPNASGTLGTQAADSFQWYSRAYGSAITDPILGATSQTLNVGQADVLFYFSVDATLNGCTERSPEVLLDAWAFLPIYYEVTGNFFNGPNGTSICSGDSMMLTLGLPFDTLITWYRNNVAMPSETNRTLVIRQPGTYRAKASPTTCPNYFEYGLNESVDTVNCTVAVDEESLSAVQIFPNPVSDWIEIRSSVGDLQRIRIYNAVGQLILSQFVDQREVRIDLQHLASGFYWMETDLGSRRFVRQ